MDFLTKFFKKLLDFIKKLFGIETKEITPKQKTYGTGGKTKSAPKTEAEKLRERQHQARRGDVSGFQESYVRKMSKSDLIGYAKGKGIKIDPNAKKEEILKIVIDAIT